MDSVVHGDMDTYTHINTTSFPFSWWLSIDQWLMAGLKIEKKTKRGRGKQKVRDEYWAACCVINADTDRLTDTYRLFHLTSSTPLDRLSGPVGLCLRLSHLDCLVFHIPDFLIECLSACAHVWCHCSICVLCVCACVPSCVYTFVGVY